MAKIQPTTVLLNDGSEITLRSPDAADAQALINFCTQIFATSKYVLTEPDEYTPTTDSQKNWIEEFHGKPGSVCIVAEHNGEIFANLDFKNKDRRRRSRHRGEFGMGILEAWRGKGLGKALLGRLIEWAKEPSNPVEKIELMVMEANFPARKLYQSLGFKEEGLIFREIKMPDNSYVNGIPMGLWIKKGD